MSEPQSTTPAGLVDPTLMTAVLAKAAKSYGQILLGAGLLNGGIATSWAWGPRVLAITCTIVGVLGILAGLLLWGKNNVSTLRGLTNVSRTFLGGSAAVWVLGLVLGLALKLTWIWWLMAALLVALGAYAAAAAFGHAKKIETAPVPDAQF